MSESEPTSTHPAGAPDWEAIARHLAGEGTTEQSAAVEAWLSAHPDDARAVTLLGAVAARAPRPAADGVNVEAALERVHGRMRADAGTTPVTPLHDVTRRAHPARRTYAPWVVAAAAATVVVAAGLARSRRDVPAAAPARVLATGIGQVDSTRLSDGTRVVLGPMSQLTIGAGYGTGRREVQLRGTGYFEVRHDADHPFSVRSGNSIVTDIGTAFTVRGDDAGGVEVSVSEGAVQLAAMGGVTAQLAAGDLAHLQSTGAMVVQRAGASVDDAAFARGRLVFRETPIARVRADLRRWYGVELVVADSTLAGRHLTASFQHDTRRQVLDVIALALGATWELRGDTVTLRPASLTVRPRK